jgi:release factor glutamine methyltransferase
MCASDNPAAVELSTDTSPGIRRAVLALSQQAQAHEVAHHLENAGVPVLCLKGPDLQQRLYGTPDRYLSSDVDILVPRRSAGRARAVLERTGWEFEPENGALWRLSRAAAFSRKGHIVDLHWGLHAAHLPGWSLVSLERDLWSGALQTDEGLRHPDAESLFVFLAVHAAGHKYERQEWIDNARIAATEVNDWDRVRAIASRARVCGAVKRILSADPGRGSARVLDGLRGDMLWMATLLARGHFIPSSVRDTIRESISLHRQGLGWRANSVRSMDYEGLQLRVPDGVFGPRKVSSTIIDMAATHLSPEPLLIADVGTGTGVLAILAARTWPRAHVEALDASRRACAAAKWNSRRYAPDRITVRCGSLLSPLPASAEGRIDLLMSNIPYVPPGASGDLEGWSAPQSAIYGEHSDGLGLMRSLRDQGRKALRPGGVWVFQIADAQVEAWQADLEASSFGFIPPSRRRPGKAVVAAARRL